MATSYQSDKFPMPALQRALALSIDDGVFANTAYYLYTERLTSSRVGKPRVVHANSQVMRAATPYLDARKSVMRAATPYLDAQLAKPYKLDTIASMTLDYGYESDSDLEDAIPDALPCDIVQTEEHKPVERQEHPTGLALDPPPYLSNELAQTPSDLMPIPPETTTADLENATPKMKSNDQVPAGDASSPIIMLDLRKPNWQHKYCVSVTNVAAPTWKALVHFICTGRIYFSPLRSQGLDVRSEAKLEHENVHSNSPPLCSPKSMYRLAHMIDLHVLKELAQQDIGTRISRTSLPRELFSRFSSTHEDILNMQLYELYSGATLAAIMPRVQQEISDMMQGKKPYCEQVVMKLLLKFSAVLSRKNKPMVKRSFSPLPAKAEATSSVPEIVPPQPNNLVAALSGSGG